MYMASEWAYRLNTCDFVNVLRLSDSNDMKYNRTLFVRSLFLMASSSRIYRIDHHHLSNNHKFDIYNAADQLLYKVHSSAPSGLGILFVCEASTDKELIKIHEENLHLHVAYDISRTDTNDGHLATVKRIHGQQHFQRMFEVDSIYGVYGVKRINSLLDHHFQLTTGDKMVVNVTKDNNFHTREGIYHAEIGDDDGGDLFLLALIIALWRAQRWYHV